MKGRTRDGQEITLTRDQAIIVRAILAWDRHGVGYTLPAVGRQGGKSTILATVQYYLDSGLAPGDMTDADWAELERDAGNAVIRTWDTDKGLVRAYNPHGFCDTVNQDTDEGRVTVISSYALITADPETAAQPTGSYYCTSREAYIDGQLILDPGEAHRLAAKAGIAVPNQVTVP